MTTQQASKIGHVMLENVRIAFAHGLFQMSQVQGQGRPAYSASFLFDKSHPAARIMWEVMQQVAQHKWGSAPVTGPDGKPQGPAWKVVFDALVAGGKVCMRDGNSKPDIAGYPGNLFVSARTTTAPLVIDQNRQPLTQASGKPYSGCYVNAKLIIWAQQNQHGKRINAQLGGVQFVRDGEPLSGGGPTSVDEFGEIEGAAQAANEFGALFGGAAPAAQPAATQDFSALLGASAPAAGGVPWQE